MEDLLAHAVDNMRIKNAGKTQLARRPEQPPPSLLVRADCWLRPVGLPGSLCMSLTQEAQ